MATRLPRYRPKVYNALRYHPLTMQICKELLVMGSCCWIDEIGALAQAPKARPWQHGNHLVPMTHQLLRHPLTDATFIEQKQPAAFVISSVACREGELCHGALPRWQVEPICHIGHSLQLLVHEFHLCRCPSKRLLALFRLDPIALPLKGIGGQGHALPLFMHIEPTPMECHTGQPQPSQRHE